MTETGTTSVLFHRDFRGFTGGHLKVWHYFTHLKSSSRYAPSVYFTPKSIWTARNPWWPGDAGEIAGTWAPEEADALFLGGLDWQAVPEAFRHAPPVPVINIIQGLSHAEPKDPKYAFLGHRAVRICVNPVLEAALRQVPHLNGPLFCVPMGLDQSTLPAPHGPQADVVIAGLKAPRLGAEIAARLARPGRRVDLLDRALPRADYLQTLAGARVAVTLPLPREGFYLPMLEAMAMGLIVVCPDCVANRAYCRPGQNGLLPAYDAAAIAEAVETALALPPNAAHAMRASAKATAAQYTLERERAGFLAVMDDLDALWRAAA